jgi:hypothetical protein
MTKLFPGRFTAAVEGEFVVFVIGMRINSLHKVHKWLPVMSSMPKMIVELRKNTDSGLLGYHAYRSGKTITFVQYWRSFEQLESFARDPQQSHFPAWKRFNQRVGKADSVGVYHETFKVAAGAYECMYVNMPKFGLAKATTHVSVVEAMNTARQRIGDQTDSPSSD